ncbi:MAG: hypothetical protein Q8Q09_18985 [Deltaproteobacteria bacterium]|nr:hypothetical protein [Deltaproteobacteria bacterium]
MSLRSRWWVGFAALIVCVFSAESHAQTSTASLRFDRPEALTDCPDERGFRASVHERLGRDAFVAPFAHTLEVRIERDRAGVRVTLQLDRAQRSVRARRCADAVRAAALSAAIALDPAASLGLTVREPQSLMGPPPVLPAVVFAAPVTDGETAPPPVLWDPVVTTPVAPPFAAVGLDLALTLHAGALVGVWGAARPGLAVGAEIHRGRFSWGMHLHGEIPGELSDEQRSARVRTVPIALSMRSCAMSPLGVAAWVCAKAQGALVIAQGQGYARDATAVLPMVTLGGEVGLDVALGGRWSLRLGLEGGVVVVRPVLRVEGETNAVFRGALVDVGTSLGLRRWFW